MPLTYSTAAQKQDSPGEKNMSETPENTLKGKKWEK